MRRMRLLSICLWIIALACSLSAASGAGSVGYFTGKIAGAWVNVVTTDLNNANIKVTPAVARRGIGHAESFRSMMRRTRPAAAINGTFFDTRTLLPTGDIAIDGILLHRGCLGTAVGIDMNNQIVFMPSRRRDLYRWSNFNSVVVAGPTLLFRGRTIVQPWQEGFRSGVHYTPHIRSAIGLTYSNKLVFVTTRRPVYLSRLAMVMKKLKCIDAAVLDGGSSSGMYWQGKLIKNPSRGMTNCLLVYDNPVSYDNHKKSFYPGYQYSYAFFKGY